VIQSRLFDLFELEKEDRLIALQKGLLFFDAIELFPYALPVIVEEERRLEDRERGADSLSLASEKERADQKNYRRFLERATPVGKRFTTLTGDGRRHYLELWARSEFVFKRRFYQATKGLIMITAYSMDELWVPIGYEGPLISRS
jgi:hypothetical protein